MKHLKSYKEKIFESDIQKGTIGKILYKIPGTDKTEVVQVKVLGDINNSNVVDVISITDVGNIPKGTKIAGVTASQIMYNKDKPLMEEEPKGVVNPLLQGSQPTPTDYNKGGATIGSGGVSNDVTLPNS